MIMSVLITTVVISMNEIKPNEIWSSNMNYKYHKIILTYYNKTEYDFLIPNNETNHYNSSVRSFIQVIVHHMLIKTTVLLELQM